MKIFDLDIVTQFSKNKKIIRTRARNTKILRSFIGYTFEVYNGQKYIKFNITEPMVGHKLGEFAFTRKIGRIHSK